MKSCPEPHRSASHPKTNVFRSLRFRLTLTNAIFVALLLVGLGFFFEGALESILDNQVRDLLNEEWAAVKGYLIIHRGEAWWQYDDEDPEEAFIVERMRRVYLVASADGKVLDASTIYKDLGLNSPEEIRAALASNQPFWQKRVSKNGEPFLIRGGLFVDDDNTRHFVAIGHSLNERERTIRDFHKNYFTALPLLTLAAALAGWFIAGRSLSPVHELARAAENISGSNLSLRIPLRNAGDELDNLIQSFNTMVERLERSFQMTRQFSTDVSHELRTPLTAIRGQLEVALFTAKTEEQYREAIANALEDVERLSHTVRAMLLLSQAESGQLALQRAPLDLSTVVEEVVEQYQIPAEAEQVSLRAQVSGPCWVDADRVQMERLISNLLSNAVKYTPSGGAIEVKLWGANGSVFLEVADTGVGIAPDHLPHIFDRFYRVPGSKKHGLGLGLSFVAWIVQVHGGKITVDSQLGQGTRFTVQLPSVLPDRLGPAEPHRTAETVQG
ncbi:MAG: heavy metal sensor histidine kinase [Bryobacteraceae bacterium]|nr:heavy metal sensor histidine kinase [Bryobacteraceae bacterium]MDW8378301.1 heavy metal sensor histidine kinase [Bryobacterales bacterium]